MPVSKKDNPSAAEKAIEDAIDESAGAPPAYEEAAEALPEKDEVQVAHKEALLAETGQEEAQAKAKIVDASPDASDTPSGAALKAVAGIEDNTERGEKYAQVKSAKRWGYVHPSLESEK